MTRITGRPEMPPGYGVVEEGPYLEWPVVERRLVEAVHYWLATARPDGRPHVVPRWGVWIDEHFWYDGSHLTRHAQNLVSNSACTLHLEDGASATILEGLSTPSEPLTGSFAQSISDEFIRKYADRGYAPGPDSWSGEDAGGMRVFIPRAAIAWSSFPDDLTRFSFD